MATASNAKLAAASSGAHFSGALLCRVTTTEAEFCLRAWPTHGPSPARLQAIHDLQLHLATVGPRITPVPIASSSGETLVAFGGRFWELTTWRPGVADASDEPPLAKLEAACEALARVHVAAAQGPTGQGERSVKLAPSPAMLRRIDLAGRMISGQLDRLLAAIKRIAVAELRQPLTHGLRLSSAMIPQVYESLLNWKGRPLPLQWRLTDVRQEHVLFTGDEATGLVDFGAAAVDSPAGDLARLVGEMAGDHPDRRRIGVAAYERRRPLSREEQAAVELFDASGLCLSVCNWANWACENPELLSNLDGPAVVARIERLVRRLENRE